MGGSHSTSVDASLQNIGINKIESGISKAEAEALWTKFDADGNGVLETKEAAALFDQVGQLAINSLKEEIETLQKHLKDEEFIAGMLAHFDTNKDGKVTKAEFIKNMVKGYHIGAEIEKVEAEVEAQHQKDAEDVAKWEAEQGVGEQEKPEAAEDEQPSTKKAKTDEAAAAE